MLFTEYRIKNHTAKNRLVRSATNEHLGELDGSVSPELIALYEQLGRGGVGTIISGHFGVNAAFRATANQPLLTEDRFIPGAAALAEAAHRHNALIYGQISQGGLQAWREAFDINGASRADLQAIPGEFAAAAKRLKAAGYDGVQVHLAHGYFLSDVLDDTVNHRADEYGGSAAGRFRLVEAVLTAVREAIGPGMDLLVKLSANNKGQTPYRDTLLYYGRRLVECGVDAIELSGADFRSRKAPERAYYLEEALALQAAVNIPVILVGGLRERGPMEDILARGIPLLSLSRPLICEPDLPQKMQQGQETSRCIGCFGCMSLYKSEYRNCRYLPESEHLRKIYGG